MATTKLNNGQLPTTLSSKTIDNTNDISTTTTKLKISGGTNGQVLSTDGSGNISWTTAGGAQVKRTVFTSSGTWTKESWAKLVTVVVISAGAGGGSGRRGATNSVRVGGSGGGSGCVRLAENIPASYLPATMTVTVGGGGNGGASQTADNTNGNNGVVGGLSRFGVQSGTEIVIEAPAPGRGQGGTQTSPVPGGAASSTVSYVKHSYNGSAGGNGTSGAGGSSNASDRITGGGGGAGQIANTTTTTAGGIGNFANMVWYRFNASGGANPGQNGNEAPGEYIIYGGGGGGGSYTTGAAGMAGGNGANYGGGGGGGSASDNGFASGAGGRGGDGVVVVVEVG